MLSIKTLVIFKVDLAPRRVRGPQLGASFKKGVTRIHRPDACFVEINTFRSFAGLLGPDMEHLVAIEALSSAPGGEHNIAGRTTFQRSCSTGHDLFLALT